MRRILEVIIIGAFMLLMGLVILGIAKYALEGM